MVRPDTDEVSGLRDIFDFRQSYDVFLSCSFTKEEGNQDRYSFYDRIGEVIKKIGKKPYLPHLEVDQSWPNEKLCCIPNSIVIPTSDIVLCDLGVPSLEAGTMIGSAVTSNIPVILLYNNESDFDGLKVEVETISPGFPQPSSPKVYDHRNSLSEATSPVKMDSKSGFSELEGRLRTFYDSYSS